MVKELLESPKVSLVGSLVITTFGGMAAGKIFDTPVPFWTVLVGILLIILGFMWQFRQNTSRYRKFTTRQLKPMQAGQRPVLIMPLSFVRSLCIPSFVTISTDLKHDLEQLAAHKQEQYRQGKSRIDFWSWEQTLRGIYHNVQNDGPLSHLILLGSKESAHQLLFFITKVLQHYTVLKHIRIQLYLNDTLNLLEFDPAIPTLQEQHGFDFEDFDGLTHAFGNLLEKLGEEGVSTNDIQIDVTGGQKPTSIVASAVTFLSNASNQYVSTNPKCWDASKLEYEVLGYNVAAFLEPGD
jgi:hypothetical protein